MLPTAAAGTASRRASAVPAEVLVAVMSASTIVCFASGCSAVADVDCEGEVEMADVGRDGDGDQTGRLRRIDGCGLIGDVGAARS